MSVDIAAVNMPSDAMAVLCSGKRAKHAYKNINPTRELVNNMAYDSKLS